MAVPKIFICAGKHCPNINTVIPSSQTPKRTGMANLALSEPQQPKGVQTHTNLCLCTIIYDKTNSSSDISGLICIDNWLLHRQSHNFVPLYLHVEVLYILDSSGSLFRRIRKSLKILMMLLLQIILGF